MVTTPVGRPQQFQQLTRARAMQTLRTLFPSAMQGESSSIALTGLPVAARLEIRTPGGSVITVPLAVQPEISLLVGTDAAELGFVIHIDETTTGLRAVAGSEQDHG